MTAPDNPDSDARVARGVVLTAAVSGMIFLVTASAQLGGTLVPSALRHRADSYRLVWPQGWEFFAAAGSADDDFAVAYRMGPAAGDLAPLGGPQADGDRLWGLSRSGYATLRRTALLRQAIPAPDWRPCAVAEITDCRAEIATAPRFGAADFAAPGAPCGTLVVAVERATGHGLRVERVAVAEVPCPR